MLQRERIRPAAIREVVSGATTLVTNLIIERHGALTALITTRGFGDVLEIRREFRYDIYDLTAGFPEPLVPRWLRFEVTERLDAEGEIVVALDRARCKRSSRRYARRAPLAGSVSPAFVSESDPRADDRRWCRR